MEIPQEGKKYWPLAVTASLALHSAIVVGLETWPPSAAEDVPAGPCQIVAWQEDEARDMNFVALATPESGMGPIAGQSPSLQAWPTLPTEKPEEQEQAKISSGDTPAVVPRGGVKEQSNPGPATGNYATDQGHGTTSFFQVPAIGNRIVYVIDASMSMGKNGALQAASRELLASIRKLPPSATFQVIIYNTHPQFLNPRCEHLLGATPEVLQALAEALDKLKAEGGTNHGPALQKALGLRPDVIYFLTDADDLKQEHLRLANRLNQGRAIIHTIELNVHNRPRPDMPLQLLARQNRGLYRAVDPSAP